MKIFFTRFLVWLVSLSSVSICHAQVQWNQTGNNYSTGKLSLGTSTFSDKLSIEGTGEWHLRLKDNSNGQDWRIGSTGDGWAAGAGKFVISNSSSSPDAAFVITPGKNIGIGTVNPSARLEIIGGIKISDLVGGGHNIIVNNGLGGPFEPAEDYHYIAKFRGNTVIAPYDAMVITGGSNGGKVGIGTVNPTAKLEVHGGIRVSDVNGGGHNLIIYNGFGGSFDLAQDYSYIAKFQGHTHGGTYNAMVVTGGVNGGRVGIGTINPDAKLAVKGTIHAEEVKVDLSVPVPDYVFEKNYNLPTLAEVENFINKNKHLPEVPAAKEMEANGVNLGEMNMLLLKKVEELTLYIIDQNKKDLEHRSLIETQLKAIRTLEKRVLMLEKKQ